MLIHDWDHKFLSENTQKPEQVTTKTISLQGLILLKDHCSAILLQIKPDITSISKMKRRMPYRENKPKGTGSAALEEMQGNIDQR